MDNFLQCTVVLYVLGADGKGQAQRWGNTISIEHKLLHMSFHPRLEHCPLRALGVRECKRGLCAACGNIY